MAASYLQSSMDKIPEARDPKLIELCINPDGTLWAEFQGDHFMRSLSDFDHPLAADSARIAGVPA